MGYNQWMAATIAPATGLSVIINNASLSYGKWTSPTSIGVTAAAPNEKAISGGSTYAFAACGRDGSPTGTTGTFSIYDTTTTPNTLIGSLSFNCPYGAGVNTSPWTPNSPNYNTQVTGFNDTSDGALGNGTITITRN